MKSFLSRIFIILSGLVFLASPVYGVELIDNMVKKFGDGAGSYSVINF